MGYDVTQPPGGWPAATTDTAKLIARSWEVMREGREIVEELRDDGHVPATAGRGP
jgi:hypothetical protein